MKTKKILSVVIPVFYFSSKENQIHALLASLQKKTNADHILEIIIVDNGNRFPEDFKNETQGKFDTKIICEPCLGLSSARNKGFFEARGGIVAFIDDDCTVAENWAEAIVGGYDDSSVFCVGGPIKLAQMKENPSWFSDFFHRFMVPVSFPEESGMVHPPFYLVGGNMSFRKDCLVQFGSFDINLGRKNKNLLSSEEIEYMLRIPSSRVWFAKDALVITKGAPTVTRIYFLRRFFWQGISDAIMAWKHGKTSLFDIGELSARSGFFKNFLAKLSSGKYFECICMTFRAVAFNAAYFMLKLKGIYET